MQKKYLGGSFFYVWTFSFSIYQPLSLIVVCATLRVHIKRGMAAPDLSRHSLWRRRIVAAGPLEKTDGRVVIID